MLRLFFDSTIALAWINSTPHLWKRFIANCKNVTSKVSGLLTAAVLLHHQDLFIRAVQIGLIRICGYLCNAQLGRNRKFPFVLPHDYKFAKLLTDQYHKKKELQANPQGLLIAVRQNFWHNCLQCFKSKPIKVEHLMDGYRSA
ncbi:hypothetical protein NPIL_208031 [Nephila pilipes]|uniref:Uncharacterized protein n=1 Tax=Nephila pilipes TaxID=299642 RepID=A0A8X6N158_NEPPI|nr:hypothetical protein NPIL_208031 [Nephila pilipes]